MVITNLSLPVSVIWFPTGNSGFSHVELKVGDQFYKMVGATITKRPEQELKNNALNGSGKPYYEFKLNFTDDAAASMQENLEKAVSAKNGNPWGFTCVRSVSVCLNSHQFKIPKFFTYLPVLLAVYLKFLSIFNKERVASIEHVGKKSISEKVNIVPETAFGTPVAISCALASD